MRFLVLKRTRDEDISLNGLTNYNITMREFRDGDKLDGTLSPQEANAPQNPVAAMGVGGGGGNVPGNPNRASFTLPTTDEAAGTDYAPGTVWEFTRVNVE